MRQLKQIVKIEANGAASDDVRARAAKAYEGKRWAGLFGEEFSTDKEDDGEESVIE